MSAGACAFSGNVAPVPRLGLFSSGLPPAFAGTIPRLQPWVTEFWASPVVKEKSLASIVNTFVSKLLHNFFKTHPLLIRESAATNLVIF